MGKRSMPADARQGQIVALLHEREALPIGELATLLGVSAMTIHRDLDALAGQGRLRKVRGGAALNEAPEEGGGRCCFCHMSIPIESHSRVALHLADGAPRWACCPHCGLAAASHMGSQVVSVLVTDFLYGRVTAAQAATYLVGPDLRLCCTPAALAFADAADAVRFQTGFGGEVLQLTEATQHLLASMSLRHREDMPLHVVPGRH